MWLLCKFAKACFCAEWCQKHDGFPQGTRIRPSGGVQSDVYNQNDNPINPYSQFSDFALNFHNFHSLVMAYLDLNNRNSERKSAGMHWASLQGLAPACDEQRRGRRRVRLQGPHQPGGTTGDQGTSEAPLLSPQSKPPMALQPSTSLHSWNPKLRPEDTEFLPQVARRKKALTNSFERFDKTAVPWHRLGAVST